MTDIKNLEKQLEKMSFDQCIDYVRMGVLGTKSAFIPKPFTQSINVFLKTLSNKHHEEVEAAKAEDRR